jgi:hypothetical protein
MERIVIKIEEEQKMNHEETMIKGVNNERLSNKQGLTLRRLTTYIYVVSHR